MKLGSLFDGAGGFPLAAQMVGITPVWASEIESYPIAVTTKNFPNMKHLGDITKINGAEIEPVDIISFGSPCQDLSVSGLRKGLKHSDKGDNETTRSGLFMEAVRLIKEMRDATQGQYPNYIIWENVPGAFSSNSGEDFRTVLTEIGGIAQTDFCVPRLEKWTDSGLILADGYSIGWRVFDARYWGLPAARRRVLLIGCFGHGGGAESILFRRKGLHKSFKDIREERQGTTAKGENSINKTSPVVAYEFHEQDTRIKELTGSAPTLNTIDRGLVLEDKLRWFTPLEFCRMQGFPDDWCDGVKGSDREQYRMWGNSVAIPCVLYIMEGIAELEKKEREKK